MKNSIHDYYSHVHKNDPRLSFDECLIGTAAQRTFRPERLTTGAVAAMLLVAVFPLLESDTSTDGEIVAPDAPLAAAQSQTGEAESNEAEMRQPERNRVVDEEIEAISTVAPEYPPAALNEGIEGWALVTFTVTAAGEVADAEITDAEPIEIFDESALEAIEQFRFNPRVVDGETVTVEGAQYLFRYNL